MRLDCELVFVPKWMLDAMKENGTPLTHLTDLIELSKLFTSEDIKSYVAINQLILAKQKQLFKSIFDCFKIKNIMANGNIDSEYSSREVKFLQDISDNANVFLNSKPATELTVFEVLSGKPFTKSNNDSLNYELELFEIKDKLFGLTIKLTDGANTIKKDVLSPSLDNLIKTLEVYYKYEELCNTSLFDKWLSNLYDDVH